MNLKNYILKKINLIVFVIIIEIDADREDICIKENKRDKKTQFIKRDLIYVYVYVYVYRKRNK